MFYLITKKRHSIMITHDPSKRRIHVATITQKTTAKVCERKPYCGCDGDIRRNCHLERD